MKSSLTILFLTLNACNAAAFSSPNEQHKQYHHASKSSKTATESILLPPKKQVTSNQKFDEQEIISALMEASKERHESSKLDKTNTEKTADGGEIELPMSKNQIKKRKRHQILMDNKMRKKEEKEAKALVEGRDLEAERRLQAERQKSGEGTKKRDKRWNTRMETADTTFKVCVDCGFEDLMTSQEINSLASQVRHCYAANKKSDNPVHLSVSSLGESSATFETLAKIHGFPDQWSSRGLSCSADPLDMMHDKDNLVYLTSDATTTLEHLDDSKTYVIGGIVDRNRLKRSTIEKADKLGIMTARLPIDDHLKLVATKVLTVNHVFEILLKYREHGNDWKKALLDVLPQRKEITEVKSNEDEDDKSESELGSTKAS
jgi:tRNA (guanine9-N1)-methyltransferase